MYNINRLEKNIKYKISFILLKFINDNRLKNISILDTKLCKDLSLIKVYIFSLNNNNLKYKINILNKASNFICKKLYKNIKSKKIPKILFLIDYSINKIINTINIINNNYINFKLK